MSSNTPQLKRYSGNKLIPTKMVSLLRQSQSKLTIKIGLPPISSAKFTDTVIEEPHPPEVTQDAGEDDECTLFGHGYKVTKSIQKTSQGAILEVVDILKLEKFIVKKVDKALYSKKESQKHTKGNNTVIAKDILKEQLLLHHTTKANNAPCHYICQLIEFFQDDQYYYMVLEHGGDTSLRTWCDMAFKYIKSGKLDIRQYRNITKYVLWQLAVLLYWLHNDMSMAYLSDIFDHLLLKQADFIIDPETGMVSINTEIEIKLCDLSLADIWKNGNAKSCTKHCGDGHNQYSAPQIFENAKVYDAERADVWSLGMFLFRMIFNQNPFQFQDSKIDKGFAAIKNGDIATFIETNRELSECSIANQFIISLINGLLCYDEDKRMTISDILHCRWFRSYWNSYKEKIISTSISQQRQLQRPAQKLNMSTFPYYDKDI